MSNKIQMEVFFTLNYLEVTGTLARAIWDHLQTELIDEWVTRRNTAVNVKKKALATL